MNFAKNDWYWQLDDNGDTRVWSTKAAAFVDEKVALDWLKSSGAADDAKLPKSPVDSTPQRKHSVQGLREAIIFYGLELGELMTNNEKIFAQIAVLEAKQTDRMIRGAALGIEEDKKMLGDIEAQIAALRAQLV